MFATTFFSRSSLWTLKPRQAQPPLSLPQVDSSSDLHSPLPSSVDPCPPLLPSAVLDLRLPLALAAVTVVVGAVAIPTAVAAPEAPLHRLPAKAGAAPPVCPYTTPRLAPSACDRTRLDRRTPSSMHRQWCNIPPGLIGLIAYLYH
jgi:hypothetical protein